MVDEVSNNVIEESRKILRELQSMLFVENIDSQAIFSKTLEIDDNLNKAAINYNKYLNEKKQEN